MLSSSTISKQQFKVQIISEPWENNVKCNRQGSWCLFFFKVNTSLCFDAREKAKQKVLQVSKASSCREID